MWSGEETVDVLDCAWEQRERVMRGASAGAYPDGGAIGELADACRVSQVAMQLEAA